MGNLSFASSNWQSTRSSLNAVTYIYIIAPLRMAHAQWSRNGSTGLAYSRTFYDCQTDTNDPTDKLLAMKNYDDYKEISFTAD